MKIIFFDGYCSLCNGFVDWVIRKDKSQELKFASLQGQTATQMKVTSAEAIDFATIVYLRNGEKFEKSTAVLFILIDAQVLSGIARVLLLIPKFICDFVYAIVARNRYLLFKKRDSCRMPDPNERGRLLP